ncbi:hypothetical protein SAMN04487925_110231 [Bradyrhizobium sp. cf659]|nr:hypothetical protein SAMN04487925_110231 [Bradyrhizobium sp. cf659]
MAPTVHLSLALALIAVGLRYTSSKGNSGRGSCAAPKKRSINGWFSDLDLVYAKRLAWLTTFLFTSATTLV